VNIFNRREIFLSWDADEINRVTGLLISLGIQYKLRSSSGRGHGVPGIRSDYAYRYQVFVHKDDYGHAHQAIK